MNIKTLSKTDIVALRKAFKYIEKYYIKFVIVLLCIFMSIAFDMIQPILSGRLIVLLLNKEMFLVVKNVVYMVSLYILGMVVGCIKTYLLNYINSNVTYDIKCKLYNKVLNLPIKAFDEKNTGEFISRIQVDASEIPNVFTDQLLNAVISVIRVLVIGITIFNMSTQLSLVVVFTFPISYSIFYVFGKILRNRNNELKKLFDKYFVYIQQSISGIKEIRNLGVESYNISGFNTLAKYIRDKEIGISLINIDSQILTSFLNIISEALVIIIGSTLVFNSLLRMDYFIAFLSYSKQFSTSLTSLTQLNSGIQHSMVSLERVFNLMDNLGYQITEYGKLKMHDFKGQIKFQNVSFEYKENEPILKKINLNIFAGKKIALVGKSGNGKTTILNLIMRFYMPTSGEIYFDNININELDESFLKSQVTIVRQEPILFNMSIKDNFLLVKPNATQDEVDKVCKLAYIYNFITDLPNKFDTIIGGSGVNLSCGQKQRIAIARALLKNSKVIIFDESTSNLDNESQEYIKMAIDGISKDHTILIISHRLSMVVDADEIFIIDNGEIVGNGTHEVLFSTNTLYRKLYKYELNSKAFTK